jgi:hypothetical protein
LYRPGRVYTTEEIEVFDHDWKSLAQKVAIPHGLYDLTLNVGYIQIGTSHDTGEFACDSIRYWWQHYGSVHYGSATSILLLCDSGGSNSSRQYLFKQDLQALVNELGISIRIAHYPLGKTCPRQAIAGFTLCVAHSYPRLVPKILGVFASNGYFANLVKIVDGSGCRTYAWITL